MAQFLKFQFFLDTFPLGFRSRLRLGSLNKPLACGCIGYVDKMLQDLPTLKETYWGT